MFRVIEVARMLGVSKVTVYKKINRNKKTLKPHIHVRSNITYVDEEGVQIIKDTIESAPNSSFFPGQDVIDLKNQSIQDLTYVIEFLNRQIQSKKEQVSKKDDFIEQLRTLSKSNRGRHQYLENKIKEMNIGG
jgi:predicted DNA-binding transcriptional regulator AlpA